MNMKTLSVTLIAIALLATGGFFTLGGVVNTDTAIPVGLYKKVDKPLGAGKYVSFCPPNRPEFQDALKRGLIGTGSCPDGFARMMLKVAAKRKDTVTINASGVYVNDSLLPESKPSAQAKDGQPMPRLTLDHYELKVSDVLLMSDAGGDPFDGRYFSVIDVQQIDSVIERMF